MKKAILFIASIGILLQVTSCNKAEVKPVNKTDLVVSNAWQINTVNFDPGFSALQIYKKDATGNSLDASKISFQFKNDGTISATDLNGNVLSGKWTFNSDESAITLPDGLPFKEVKIEELTENTFNISVSNFQYTALGQNFKGLLTVNMIPKS